MMKNFLFYKGFLLLCFSFLFIACEDEENPSGESSAVDTTRVSIGVPLHWKLASTPNTENFNNSDAINNWAYNYDRAKSALYYIDVPNLSSPTLSMASHYNRVIHKTEVYPDYAGFPTTIRTLDFAFFPSERGPYNFNIEALDFNGHLTNPTTRWGGFQKNTFIPDVILDKIEFFEFWLMDPFLENPSNEGYLYINLGTVSEDILKDGRISSETGLPVGTEPENTDTTKWARVANSTTSSDSFISDAARDEQDLGLDGLDNAGERIVFSEYLQELQLNRPDLVTAGIYDQIEQDPSNDDFRSYLNGDWPNDTNIPRRYSQFNNPEGNSISIENNTSFTLIRDPDPDNEDLNNDHILEETEAFVQYGIVLHSEMDTDDEFITEVLIDEENVVNGVPARWLKFKIPIDEYHETFGNVGDFNSMQSFRFYLTGFAEPVVLRFVDFNLVAVL